MLSDESAVPKGFASMLFAQSRLMTKAILLAAAVAVLGAPREALAGTLTLRILDSGGIDVFGGPTSISGSPATRDLSDFGLRVTASSLDNNSTPGPFAELDLGILGLYDGPSQILRFQATLSGISPPLVDQLLRSSFTGTVENIDDPDNPVVVSARTWVDISDPPGFGTGSIPLGPTPGFVGAFATTVTTYSLTTEITIELDAGDFISLDLRNTVSTPEPTGIALMLIGSPFLGIGAWIRRRRSLPARTN